MRLLVLASEYDGRDWIRLSEDAELLEIPGDHFDLVTVRINDLAGNLRSWFSGNAPFGLSEPRPLSPTTKDETSPTGPGKRESQPSRQQEGELLAPAMSDEEIAPPLAGAAKHESLSRRLKRLFNYARR